MRTEKESVCCRELDAADQKRKEQEERAACITQHTEFEVVCIRKSVLEVAMIVHQEFRARCDPWSNRYMYYSSILLIPRNVCRSPLNKFVLRVLLVLRCEFLVLM